MAKGQDFVLYIYFFLDRIFICNFLEIFWEILKMKCLKHDLYFSIFNQSELRETF